MTHQPKPLHYLSPTQIISATLILKAKLEAKCTKVQTTSPTFVFGTIPADREEQEYYASKKAE